MDKNISGGKTMAEGKKPAVMTIAGVIELVFSIFIFIYAISSMVMGCAGSVMGMAGSVDASGTINEATASTAWQGAGMMILITVITSLAAFVMGIIGIIGATNLFKGKKAGVGLSNFWAIALLVIFAAGLVPAILQLSAAGTTAGAITDLTKNMTDTTAKITSADIQSVTTGLPMIMIVLSGICYLLPAILVFVLLKLKPVKDFFAAPQAQTN
jgi:hypothetical protein